MQWLIEKIPEAQLSGWLWWLKFLAIAIPITGAVLGAFTGWGVWRVGDRIADLKAIAQKEHQTQAKIALDQANQKSQDATQQAEQAHQIAEQYSKRTAELEGRLAHRSLNSEQKAKFLEFVKNHPKGRVTVHYMSQIPDREFAVSLQSLFKEAGFDVDPWLGPSMAIDWRPIGVKICVKNKNNEPSHAGALQRGLISIGIDAKGSETPKSAGWDNQGEIDLVTVVVVIGYKE